ncbi:MAG: transcriptional regulator [Rothia mucilaginosa]|uniref:Transcriptional regulator n=1 Tax=Rothia mucilaginosa TaxID=43675 RepID=A0A930LV98_9MICC|nr:transcriptional regulator [Rothia mucilaginosa]
MSSFSQSFSRRSLLRLGLGASAVAGSAALLSACGSGSSSQQSGSQGGSLNGSKSSANPNGYSDDGKNYSGLVEYTHYEGAVNYEQGTVDHPPRNAPKPKVTDTLSLNTVTGFHEAIAYFAAAMDYLVKTGSTDAFSTGIQLSSKTRSEVDALSASILAGVEKGSWYVNPSASYALSSAQPSIMSDGNLLFKGKYTLDFGAEAVAEGKIQPVVASASTSAEPSEDALVSDAASPTASATASAAGPASQVTVQECDFRGRYHADSKMWELSVAYGATVQGGTAQGGASTASAAASGAASGSASASAAASAEASTEASATSAAS